MIPDIKKLIAGFLACSLLATLFILIAPSFLSQTPASVSQENNSTNIQNAFTPKSDTISSVTSGNSEESAQSRTLTPSTNLTQRLGNLLAREIINTNEEAGVLSGPPEGLAVPKQAALEATIKDSLSDASSFPFSVPDFTRSISDSALSIIENPSAEDYQHYTDATQGVLEKTIWSKNFQNLLEEESPSIESAYAATTVYGTASRDLAQISVPAPLVSFHKKITTVVINRKKLTDLALDNFEDPLKSIAILKQLDGQVESIIEQDLTNLHNEAERIRTLSLHAPVQSGTRNLADYILGIDRAFAQGYVPVDATGPVSKAFQTHEAKATTTTWLRRLWEWGQKIFLQQLKNQLISLLEQQIVNWINGGGSPQFVTDWQGFISTAFNNAAGAAIQEILPGLCQPSSPLLRISLVLPSVNIPVYSGCTLNQVISNVKNFYSSFRSGGWVQYGVTFEPTGNYFGAIIEGHDRVTRTALAAADAAKNKALAGSGFLSTEVCPSTNKSPGAEGCPGGEHPLIRTPGSVLGATVTKALGSNFDLIVNANDIGGLVQTVTNAALTRIVTLGLSAVSGKPSGLGLSNVAYTNNSSLSQGLQSAESDAKTKATVDQTNQESTFDGLQTSTSPQADPFAQGVDTEEEISTSNNPVSLAENKPVRQSSTWVSRGSASAAEYAVDGRKSNSLYGSAVTDRGGNSWLVVDLQEIAVIDRVDIQEFPGRLFSGCIIISAQNPGSSPLSCNGSNGVTIPFAPTGAETLVSIPVGKISGRYVWVQQQSSKDNMIISELGVFGAGTGQGNNSSATAISMISPGGDVLSWNRGTTSYPRLDIVSSKPASGLSLSFEIKKAPASGTGVTRKITGNYADAPLGDLLASLNVTLRNAAGTSLVSDTLNFSINQGATVFSPSQSFSLPANTINSLTYDATVYSYAGINDSYLLLTTLHDDAGVVISTHAFTINVH
ncbi:MAG: discoidin domain-containing protein [Patescibacteria group bacterium]|nr:discoidin domain-containing protein [Patescibacteria group bacterium]